MCVRCYRNLQECPSHVYEGSLGYPGLQRVPGHSDKQLRDISSELEHFFDIILDEMKATFPPPDQAPTHEERREQVASVCAKAERAVLEVAHKHGLSDEQLDDIRVSLERMEIVTTNVVVLIGKDCFTGIDFHALSHGTARLR